MILMNDCPVLPPRDSLGHKGVFGKVCVIGGSWGHYPMIGAPALAGRAALRSGCGLCTVAVPAPIVSAVLTLLPGATAVALPLDTEQDLSASGCLQTLEPVLAHTDTLLIGPGFGRASAQQDILWGLLDSFSKPLILDADALHLLAQRPAFTRAAPLLLTPHPGEFQVLAQALNLHLNAVDEQTRDQAALTLAERLECVVILKGPYTRVSDGRRLWRSPHAEAALAIGGSGDVLSGICAAFAAQFTHKACAPYLDLFQVACLAVQIHALAAMAWSSRHGHAGLFPEELADGIPLIIAQLRGELI